MLPLDLHVLSLSLAFILSQDQTLRCSNCFFISSARIPSLHRSPRSSYWRYSLSIYSIPILVLLVVLCKYPQRSSRYRSTTIVVFSIAGAKVRLSFKPPNFSASFLRFIFHEVCLNRPFLPLIKAVENPEKFPQLGRYFLITGEIYLINYSDFSREDMLQVR